MYIDENTPIWLYIIIILFIFVFIYRLYKNDADVMRDNCKIAKVLTPSLKEKYNSRDSITKEQDIYKLKQDISEINKRNLKTKKLIATVIEGFCKGALLGLIASNGKLPIIGKSALTWAIMPILLTNLNSDIRKVIG